MERRKGRSPSSQVPKFSNSQNAFGGMLFQLSARGCGVAARRRSVRGKG